MSATDAFFEELKRRPDMGRTRVRIARTSRASDDSTYELRIKAALDGLSNGDYKNKAEAARAQKVCH